LKHGKRETFARERRGRKGTKGDLGGMGNNFVYVFGTELTILIKFLE